MIELEDGRILNVVASEEQMKALKIVSVMALGDIYEGVRVLNEVYAPSRNRTTFMNAVREKISSRYREDMGR